MNWPGTPKDWTPTMVSEPDMDTEVRDRSLFFKQGFDDSGNLLLETLMRAECQGRLSLVSGTPVTTTDQTAKTTVYFTPIDGGIIGGYDGTVWQVGTFTEKSVAVPATTNTMYDIFGVMTSGLLTSIEAVAWTNDTTRATDIVLQDNIYVKSGTLTKRYLGSFRTTGTSGQTEDSFAKRYVSNYYNRRPRILRVTEATDSWAYSTASYRQMNNSTANQVDIVVCGKNPEYMLELAVHGFYHDGGAPFGASVSIGEDGTTECTGVIGKGMGNSAGGASSGFPFAVTAHLRHYPAIGRHFYPALELGTGSASTWYGDNGAPTKWQAGLYGCIWM